MATITKLRTANSSPATKMKSAAWRRRMQRQRYCSYGTGTISLILTILSLSHLASGIQLLTHADLWHAWAMAIGIDLSFIGLELTPLCAVTPALRASVTRFCLPAVKATLATSALMNAYAFALESPSIPFAVAASILGTA